MDERAAGELHMDGDWARSAPIAMAPATFRALGHRLVDQLAEFLDSLPVPKRLRDTGIRAEVLEPVAREAAASPTVQANPKPVSESDLLELLRGAW